MIQVHAALPACTERRGPRHSPVESAAASGVRHPAQHTSHTLDRKIHTLARRSPVPRLHLMRQSIINDHACFAHPKRSPLTRHDARRRPHLLPHHTAHALSRAEGFAAVQQLTTSPRSVLRLSLLSLHAPGQRSSPRVLSTPLHSQRPKIPPTQRLSPSRRQRAQRFRPQHTARAALHTLRLTHLAERRPSSVAPHSGWAPAGFATFLQSEKRTTRCGWAW